MSESYANENMDDYEEKIAWGEVGVPPGEGKYNFSIESAEYKPTQARKHMIKLQFKIEGAVDPNNEKFIGRTVFGNFVFTQQAAFTVKAFCKNLDIPLPETVNKAVLEDWLAEHLLTGLIFGATVKHRPFNGQMQADLGQSFEPAFDIGGAAIDTSGQDTVDTSGQDESEMLDSDEGESEPEPVVVTRSIREAAPNGKATNGHTNGTKPKPKSTDKKDKPQATK